MKSAAARPPRRRSRRPNRPRRANRTSAASTLTLHDEKELAGFLEELDKAGLVGFDTETTGLEPMLAKLVGMSFAFGDRAWYLPLAHEYPGAPDQMGVGKALALLKPWLESDAHRKVGQNLKFDAHILANHGVTLGGIAHDTLLESYVYEVHERHDMDSMAMRHLGWKTITYDEVTGKGASRISFSAVEIGCATEYAAEDADFALSVHAVLFEKISADEKLKYVYERIEMPAMPVLMKMERNGVLIDGAKLDVQSHELGKEMLAIEQKAYEAAGQPFNLNSPKQIQEILFDKQKLPVKKKTPKGQPSTDEDVLAELALDYPLPKLLLEYRSLAKLKSTYTDKLPRMVDPNTGRVHTTYSQATAVTGRLASNDPNLQNIPIRTPQGRRIREAFIAPPGSRIVSADYSQIELRIMAHLSGDKGLLHAFEHGHGRAPGHRGRGFRRAAGQSEQGRAPHRQSDQLRPDLRYERVRPGAEPRPRARHCAGLHRVLLQPLPRGEELHGQDPGNGPLAWLRRNRVRPAPAPARNQFRLARPPARAPSAPPSTRRCRAPPPT